MRSWRFRDPTFWTLRCFMHSCSHLAFFPDGSGIMMSACKARGLGEVSRGDSLQAQSWYFDGFFHVLVTSYLEFSPGLKIQCQSDPEPPPGRKFSPGIEIGSETTSKPTKNWENEKIEKNSRKLQDSSILHLQICIFALLTRGSQRSGFASPLRV